MDERRVSIIIVPPGGARTVQCSISVSRIRLLVTVVGLATVTMLGSTAVGLSLWDTAANSRALEIENDSLRVAITRMSDLDQRLSDLERAGGRIRDLLVVDRKSDREVSVEDVAPRDGSTGEPRGENGEVGYAEVSAQ